MTVQAGPWVGFWPLRTVDQTITTTLGCTAPLLCHAKPFDPKALLYSISRVFKFANFVNFQLFTKMYHRNFFTCDKRFSYSDWTRPCSKHCFANSSNSSGQQQVHVWSTWPVCLALQYMACKCSNHFKEMFKNCYLLKIRLLKILHCTLCPSYNGIGILSLNTVHKIILLWCY